MNSGSTALATESIPDRLFDGLTVPKQVTQRVAQQLNYPPAAQPTPDNVVPPPGENRYFPIRSDDQPYFLMVDKTINITDALNRFYYDPKWRGEVWTPPDLMTLPEKATRLLSTWPEYNEQSILRVGNGMAQWIEKLSGYGP